MGHHTLKSSYQNLVDRINRFPQGAPPSEALYAILKILINEKEAHVLSQLPIKPFTLEVASRTLHMNPKETASILDELASRAILVDIEAPDGQKVYTLPPPMAGFFEFSLMRIRTDIDQKLLSELFYQYLNVEEDFVRELFTAGETRYGRILVNEAALDSHAGAGAGADAGVGANVGTSADAGVGANVGTSADAGVGANVGMSADEGTDADLHILDYERASSIIKSSPKIGVGVCYCRHKMLHAGTVCDAPMEICMTFNGAADSLIRHGHAKEISISECMRLLEKAYDHNLVQIGENQQKELPFICNCCGCCCEALLAIKRFGTMQSINTTNFIPVLNQDVCNNCGLCVKACPVGAISIEQKQLDDSAASGAGAAAGAAAAAVAVSDLIILDKNKKKITYIMEEKCLGCGICIRACKRSALKLKSRPARVITPVNSVHRIVLMAIERGKLQNLIFDNQAHASHRALAAILGAILRLPLVQRTMASDQIRSKYLVRLIQGYDKMKK